MLPQKNRLISKQINTGQLKILIRFTLAIGCLLFSEIACSQSIGATIFSGNIIRHRESLSYEQPNFTAGIQLEYLVKKNPSSAWQQFWRLPDITHHFHYNNFGNKAELGSVFAYYPSINFKLWGKDTFKGYCQIGNGVAYINNPFDINNNPKNNAIGSHWNSIIVLKLEAKMKLQEKLYLNFGPQLYHYSNGSAKAPNLGINNLSLGLGLKYRFTESPVYKRDPAPDLSEVSSQRDWKRWNYELNIGLGFRQINIPNSLNYRVPQINLFTHYNVYQFFRVVGGFSYEYNYANYHFFKTQFQSEEDANKKARDFQFKLAGDFVFGKLFSRFQLGYYLPVEGKEIQEPISTMFSLNYARKIVNNQSTKMFVGVGVRSHKFVAQYLSIDLGFIL